MPTATLPSVTLPGVAVPLSRVGLGTMSFGDTVGAAEAETLFETAVEAGITVVDTANGYAGGESERLLGPWVRRRRDQLVLATKAGIPHPDAEGAAPLSASALRRCLEGSLRRLGVDSVDLFYLHQPDRSTPLAETLGAVAELHAEGRLGALGVSNYAAWQVQDVLAAARAAGAPAPVAGQNVYNLLARRIEDEWLEFAAVHGVHTMVYNPLAGGLLGRRPGAGEQPSRFGRSRLAAMYSDRYLRDDLVAAATGVADLAEESGTPMAELALRWLLGRDGVDSVLLGGSRVSHLRANLDALARGPLPADLADRLEQLSAPLKGAMPPYHR
ncbi:aldo/keto reductase [Desertihabitans aurantiacus]|uniref:aldo/keto reductase n=1 Tax=Desertihabitans aurantiacus TaxID=2282477 RepID=UPI000DF85836|nr:aldo/keto reductase [Desertihabitans aurantiacus]